MADMGQKPAIPVAYLQQLQSYCKDTAAFQQLQHLVQQLITDARSNSPALQPEEAILEQFEVDTDDRRWANLIVPENRLRFRSLMRHATDVIVFIDPTHVCRYCSPSIEHILGYLPSAVLNTHLTDWIHPDDQTAVLTALSQASPAPETVPSRIEFRLQRRDGSWCIFDAVITSWLADPAIAGIVLNCHDITEHRQIEEALRMANHQIANILESIADAFVSLDADWRLTYLNSQARTLLGRSQADLLGQTFWSVWPQLNYADIEPALQTTLEQQIPTSFEQFLPTVNRWFEVRAFPSVEGLSIFFLDITERKQAQAELLEMSTALGNAVEGIARLDIHDQFIALNRAYAATLGYRQEEVIGKRWQEMVHPDDIAAVEIALQAMLAEGKGETEVRAIRQDGVTFHQEWVLVAAYDWYDQFIGYHCFTKDITERKQAEQALRQQAEREQLMGMIAQRVRQSLDLAAILNTTVSEVRQLLKADRVVIYRCQPSGSLVMAESVADRWPSLLGSHLHDVWAEDFWLTVFQASDRPLNNLVIAETQGLDQPTGIQQLMQERQIRALLAVPILHGDRLWGVLVAHQCVGGRQWDSLEVSLLEQLSTQVAIAIQQSELYQQVQVLASDLEQQVQERTAELQQSLQFEALLKRITDAVRDSLDEERILQTAIQELGMELQVAASDAALYDLDQRTSTIRYEHIRNNLPPARGLCIQMAASPEIYGQLLEALCFQYCQLVRSGLRPLERQYTILSCPLVNDQGVMGDLWLFKAHDELFSPLEIRLVQQVANQCAIAIRQARLYQASLAQVAALEELNQLKDDFLSTVSHELRTPMSNMKMAIHLLRTMTSPDRQAQYLDILQSECLREIELINDLLDLQRLEASSYTLSCHAIDLQDCLSQLVVPFQSRAVDRQQQLTIDLAPDLPTIQSDRACLERVLAELLNNACKYTSPGQIVMLVVRHQNDHILFEVRNQAEIPKLELGHIFEKFYRVPNSDRWKQGGTGLGLALVQRLVQQLGGRLDVASQQGWTTFTLTLPTHIAAPIAAVPTC